MTDIPTITLECKKDGLTQRQDGTAKLTLVVNAEDMNDAISKLWAAPMGTRYQVVMVEIGDDEQPVDRQPKPGDPVKSVKGYAKPPMTESQRCGMLCADGAFQGWLERTCKEYWDHAAEQGLDATETAAATMRMALCVGSRRELDDPNHERVRYVWQSMLAQFEADTGRLAERTR